VAIQKEIAEGASADRCDRGDHDDSEQIEVPVTRCQHTAHGKHRHTSKI
jgi:hypothetical protein